MTLVPRLPSHAETTIHAFLRAQVEEAGARGVVVGLSGGIDSAVTARLARDALGAARVLGVLLPGPSFPPALATEIEEYARGLGIEHRTVPIGPAEVAMQAMLPDVHDRTTRGNASARLRMTVLYAIARDAHRLVLGTGNKSEILLGYFTKYGDGGTDLAPLGDLYKTEVRELAERLDLPGAIRSRPPTAGLWEGQTDEEELGAPYSELDQVLRGMEELRNPEEIAQRTGIPLRTVRSVEARVAANRHKRRLAPIPKLSLRTVGIDWRD
jgi:NAD+ synthase